MADCSRRPDGRPRCAGCSKRALRLPSSGAPESTAGIVSRPAIDRAKNLIESGAVLRVRIDDPSPRPVRGAISTPELPEDAMSDPKDFS